MHIILFPPGGCGSVVSAVIDPVGAVFVPSGHIIFGSRRRLFQKKFYQTHLTDEDRDKALQESTCKSLVSHAYEYHVNRRHDYILIDCDDPNYIPWIQSRIEKIYNVDNANDMPAQIKKFTMVTKPHTNKIIRVSDIVEGRLIQVLKQFVDTPLNEELYNKWLAMIHEKFPTLQKNQ